VRVFVLSSGSCGNCLVVDSNGARVIVDAGINPTRGTARMRALGEELVRGGDAAHALAILVTHHHADHIAHAQPLARALRAPLYFHDGIAAARLRDRFEVGRYSPGTALALGPFRIDALHVPHDAPQVALRIATEDRAFGIATDIGHPTDVLAEFLATCDEILLEANHCPQMLDEGPYPAHLKKRIRGPLGHLANDETATIVGKIQKVQNTRVSRVWLGHISQHNNTPERALEVVRAAAPDLAIAAIDHGSSAFIDVRAVRNQLAFTF
jgi:phosphoribosyl 1,2-cyclic phosphodiesterase